MMEEKSSLNVGELFKKSWKIFLFNWRTFIGIALIWWLIFAFWTFLFKICPSQSTLSYFGVISLYIVLFLISLWDSLSLINAIKYWKKKIGILESFKRSQSKIFDFFIIGLLTFVMVLTGFLLLIVPGIMFWVYLILAPFVLVCENIRGKAALKRSWSLVKSHWWEVFAKLVMLITVIFALSFAVSMGLLVVLFILKLSILPLQQSLPVLYKILSRAIGFISEDLPSLIILFTLPFSQIYTYLIYKDLKRIKDLKRV